MSLRDAADTILQSQVKPDGSFDTLATVLRTDGDTVWVHIDGGAPETPCKKTVECRAGESVMVRISGGSAWITGNHTSPSTDDTEAEKAKEEARKAAGTATSFITDSDNGIFVHPKNSTQRGVRVTDVVDIVRDGKTVAEFGEEIRIGQDADGQSRTEISTDGMQIVRKANGSDTQIANLGYGLGNGESGTAYAPYYTLGIRSSDSGSGIGNYSIAEGVNNVSKGYCSHAEGYRVTANASYSHAEGYRSRATNYSSHAEGVGSEASGLYSHAEGVGCTASGDSSHAQNYGTTAGYESQTAIGKYNDNKAGNAFEIGWGTENFPQNILEIDTYGNLTCANVGAPVDISSDFTVSKTSGNSTCTVRNAMKSGNMIMLGLSFKCTSAYTAQNLSDHANLFVGTVPEKYKPACTTSGVGYIDNQAVVARISGTSTRQITVRPTAQLDNGKEPYIYFTYFI